MATLADAVAVDEALGGWVFDLRVGDTLAFGVELADADGTPVPMAAADAAGIPRDGALWRESDGYRLAVLSQTLYSGTVGAAPAAARNLEPDLAGTTARVDVVQGQGGAVALRIPPDIVASPAAPNAREAPVVLVQLGLYYPSGARRIVPCQIVCRHGVA